ncbi:MAG: MFS transporter [Chloroflexota bacterium]
MNLGRLFRFPPELSPQLRSNYIFLLWDIGVWGFYMGSTVAFLTIYAARVGATPEEIGLLTALPALLSLLLAVPVGQWLKRFPAGPVTAWGAFVARFLLVVYVILPWALPPTLQVQALLVMAVILALPNTVISISFNQFFIEAIPTRWRGTVVGARNAIMSIVSFVVTLLCGQVLTYVAFPRGYQIVFFIGFAGALATAYMIARVRPVPDSDLPLLSGSGAPAARWRLPALDANGRAYLKVIGLLFWLNFTNNMAAPLVPDLLVGQLKLSDAMISVGTATTTFLTFVISLRVARFTLRTGNRKATAIGAGLLAVQAITLALATNALFYLVSAVIAGIAIGVLGAAQYNYPLDHLPSADRPNWLSYNVLLGNAAILLGALAGPLIARFLGIPGALIAFGALRLLVGIAILRWG